MHHKHTSAYMKTYFPYLPILAVVGVGVVLNKSLDDAALFDSTGSVSGLGYPTRIEAIAGTSGNWALLAVVLIAGLAMAAFIFLHWYRVQRTLNRGEAFIAKHPWFDVVLAFLITAGVILTRRAV